MQNGDSFLTTSLAARQNCVRTKLALACDRLDADAKGAIVQFGLFESARLVIGHFAAFTPFLARLMLIRVGTSLVKAAQTLAQAVNTIFVCPNSLDTYESE